jgi:hypothetical protein
MLRPFYPLKRSRTVHIVQESEWSPGTVWADAENLAPTRARDPDHTARVE